MLSSLFCFFVALLFPCSVASFYFPSLYVWNVGQGQWITYEKLDECFHFDIGGEKAPLKRIKKLCEKKQNIVFVSHSDFDHIRYLGWARVNFNDVCLYKFPQDRPKPKNEKVLKQVELCQNLTKSDVTEIRGTDIINERNALSRVFVLHHHLGSVLIPGDSTAAAEKNWIPHLSSMKKQVRFLILGHHGSYTSTSLALLKNLPDLKLAISSARKKRYGHPHSKTEMRLQSNRIPLLKTEYWNNIKI